jgi:hypothetical protein
MKKIIVLSALVSVLSIPAFAQSTETAVDQVKKDNAKIQHETKDIKKDKSELAEERIDRNKLQAKEDKEIKEGDTIAAEKLEKKREHEQKKIDHEKKYILKDKKKRAEKVEDRSEDAAKIK